MFEVASSTVMLRTKLHRPPLPVGLVRRSRLLALLDRYRCQPFTLYSAPAGYGKTTLVNSWTDKLDRPTAWLSLDEHDRDLGRFLNHVIAAIRTCFPDACRTTLGLLNITSLPAHDRLVRCLSNDLNTLAQDITLVLDNYHHIRATAIHDLLNELLRYPPRPLHLVVVTRYDPPFALSALRARGQMTEIRQQDLRFTMAETAAFLKLATGVDIDDRSAAALTDKTEGWVTGLRLLTLALGQQGNVDLLLRALPAKISDITEYLISEVLSQSPQEVEDFLLKTSILNRFCASLCDAVRDEKVSLSDPPMQVRSKSQGQRTAVFRHKQINPERWQFLDRLLRLSLSDRVESPASTCSPPTLDEFLTSREFEVLQLLALRLQTKEIAELLCIAPATVKTHLKHLYQKFEVSGRRQVVARAHAMGLID